MLGAAKLAPILDEDDEVAGPVGPAGLAAPVRRPLRRVVQDAGLTQDFGAFGLDLGFRPGRQT